MAREGKKRAVQPEKPADELVDVLLILAKYLDTKGLQEMILKMSDGYKIGVRVGEDIFARYCQSEIVKAKKMHKAATDELIPKH